MYERPLANQDLVSLLEWLFRDNVDALNKIREAAHDARRAEWEDAMGDDL